MQKDKIRILYVIDKMVRAGAQNHLRQVITGLDPFHFKPLLCCLLYKGPLAKELEDDGYQVESLQLENIMGLNFFRSIRRLIGIIRRHRIDLVHSYLFAANIVAPPVGLLTGIPVITSRRDAGFWKKRQHILAHRVVNHITGRITANSGEVIQYLGNREKVKKNKIALIRNGMELPPLRNGMEIPGDSRGRFIIGMLGNIRPVKGYEYLLTAISRLSAEYSFEVHIAGRILDREYYNKLKIMIGDNHLTDRVIFRGEIEDPESFLKELHIFVLPSLSEGFSNALLEAMGNGLAVIATTVGGNREMITDGKEGFLVRLGESDDLVIRLSELMDRPELISILGAAARKRISEEFSAGKMCRQMELLYLDCLKKPRK